ncbi:hypothetical protein AVEN_187311-1 [Araneus ventricosus]|uniref:Uncharacterized protein n=1 Tax=Araneus ventricosus TaxID=182803 RepID=A0A4Y2RM31_ARAVE|nr:hypothetical protein AVEN_187311-1 [Araneus ventricosus]
MRAGTLHAIVNQCPHVWCRNIENGIPLQLVVLVTSAVQEIRAGSSWLKRDFNLTKQSTDSVATIFRRVLQSHKANTTSGRGDLVGRSRQRMVGSVASSGPDSTEDPPCLWS